MQCPYKIIPIFHFPVGLAHPKSMQTTAEYYCAYCGEPNTTFIDISTGLSQQYVEDCQVCCRPNILYITIDEETLDVDIQTDCEDR